MKILASHRKQMAAMMITGAFVIFFTGFVHVWSIYQPYVIDKTGWTENQASLCFYLSSCVFVFGNIIGGKIQDKSNPRVVVFIGGCVFSLGVTLSSFLLIQNPVPMYLSFGVMQGFGQGMVYSVVLATAQKWFPGRVGFASGVIVTANGLCAFFLAPISRILLKNYGPQTTLFQVGCVMMLAWLLVSVFLVVPKNEWFELERVNSGECQKLSGQRAVQYKTKEMIKTSRFYFMVLSMMFGLIPYYLVSPVSQTMQMNEGIAASIAVGSVMCGSVLNAMTRLVLPSVADRVGRIRCVQVIFCLSLAAMLMLVFFGGYASTIAVVLMYVCFGGIMGNFPALTSAVFGIDHFGENYGYVMLGMVAASMGSPIISSIITGNGYSIHILFGIGSVFAFMANVCLILLKRELKEQRV